MARATIETARIRAAARDAAAACALAAAMLLGACGGAPAPSANPARASIPPRPTAALSAEEAAALHESRSADGNELLIFGAARAPKPDPTLDSSLAAFLGRWEGYDFAPPVSRDLKIVLAIQRMASEGGEGFLWAGTNL